MIKKVLRNITVFWISSIILSEKTLISIGHGRFPASRARPSRKPLYILMSKVPETLHQKMKNFQKNFKEAFSANLYALFLVANLVPISTPFLVLSAFRGTLLFNPLRK